MDLNPPLPLSREAQSSTRWIYFAIVGICLAVVFCYIWRPWRPDLVAKYSYEQLLLNPSERHGLRGGNKTIKLGILHSLTGVMAVSEKPMVDAELMAVEEINQKTANTDGGILGAKVEAIVADGRSDPAVFAAEAERLISTEKVCAIVGCFSTESRLAVRKVVEKHNHLLIYPQSYEGFEISTNIIYTGAAPNQRIGPAIRWSFDNLGKQFFFVGSDDPSQGATDEIGIDDIIHEEIRSIGGFPLGENYIPLQGTNVPVVISRIMANLQRTRPDVIVSAVEGDSNVAFFKALHEAGITNPVVSISLGEDELRKIPAGEIAGDYVAASYFQNLDRPENHEFVARFKQRYGQNRSTSDAIETAYFSVLLWKQAVAERGSDRVKDIRRNLLNQSLDAPEGVVSIDRETRYAWRSFSIGRIGTNGEIAVVWTARKPIRPLPLNHRGSLEDYETLRELRKMAVEDYTMPFDEAEP